MSCVLPPPKVVLLAVHFASNANISSLTFLASRHPAILHKVLVLRILLTYLPETLPSVDYVSLIEELSSDEYAYHDNVDVDYSTVDGISDDEASRRVRRLHLLPLFISDAPVDPHDDAIARFLLRRAHRVDEEAGLLTQIPPLLTPFLHRIPDVRLWMLSTVLPLLRHNYEYHPTEALPYTLAEFQKLPDAEAVQALLSRTGGGGTTHGLVGRDLRGLLGPWLHNDQRWTFAVDAEPALRYAAPEEPTAADVVCPGWEAALEWITSHARCSWQIAVAAVEQWDGPQDVDLGEIDSWLTEDHQRYLDRRYARAVLACAYLIPENNSEALEGAHRLVVKAMSLLGEDDCPSLSNSSKHVTSSA